MPFTKELSKALSNDELLQQYFKRLDLEMTERLRRWRLARVVQRTPNGDVQLRVDEVYNNLDGVVIVVR